MTILAKRDLDVTVEKKIATASIISEKFLQEILPIYDPNYIKNSFVKIICHWCLQYFEEYGKSPKTNIKNIFDLEKGELSQEETDIIEAFLVHLSEQYEEDQGINEDYILDSALKYFKKRELEIIADNIAKLLSIGKVDEAEEQIRNYKKVEKLTTGWYDVFDEKQVRTVFDANPEGLLRFPGELGRMIGPMERGWVIGVMGAFKRGKTWVLIELATLALFQRLKVVFISLEMNKETMNARFYKRLTAFGEGATKWIYPVFDCHFNQVGECGDPRRKNRERLIGESGEIPPYSEDLAYRPCTECRGTVNYRVATWFQAVERPQFTMANTVNHIKSFKYQYGSNIRAMSYPKFSANIEDIKRDLDLLEQNDEFIPDVIVIDYAGILRPENPKMQKREQIDDTWKILGQLASERNCLVVSAWQANRGALYKKQMDQEGVSEWIGILGHVDVFLAINQTKEEKRHHLVRIGLLGHRHKEFNEEENCIVLQQLSLGQVNLDSERTWDFT
jgi:hypothetical protein